MANVKRELRVSDNDIRRLNHIGLGLKAIATHLGCHSATVTLRLQAMGIKPVDTRRSFMEGVFADLSKDEQDWLSHNLFNMDVGVREFVSSLIREAYRAYAKEAVPAAPAPMPEMDGGGTEPKTEPVEDKPRSQPKKKLAFK